MNVSEVMDIEGSFTGSEKLEAGQKITIQGLHVKYVDGVGADVAELKTTSGLKHSFGKTVVGQAKSEYWNDLVNKCVEKDASDGLDAWVVERQAEGSQRTMLALSMFPPKQNQTAD
jgi:hypothetical protein|tara:strand:+ start:692 stop:1039 length:348 start_codon:yes stop_codon:yes gene_type:complete